MTNTMTATDKIKQIQTILFVQPDGIFGDRSREALGALVTASNAERVGQAVTPSPSGTPILGDGTWPWTAQIDGDDVVVLNARATCFGGSDDPQDSGETASGISTKDNPDLAAVSLPMDGRQFHGLSPEEHAALDGSPIPRVPWKTLVRVTSNGITHDLPVIDLGPGKRTKNALDLSIASARLFNPRASATNFEMICDYRVIGGAKFATQS